MNKRAIFFLISFILSFFVSLFFNYSKINIPNFYGLNKKIGIDVVFKNDKISDIFLDKEKDLNRAKIDKNHYLFLQKNYKKVENISFSNPENIEKLQIYLDYKLIDAEKSENIKIDNSKNIFDKISILILSFFYNFQYFIFSYIFLFLFFVEFKYNFKTKNILIFILTLAGLLRLTELNSVPFWDDEIYVLAASANYSSILELFNDPGNPPLYFILFKIYRSIVQNSTFYRLSSVLLGVSFVYFFYLYLKKFINTKNALIGAFLASINIILIHFSQELRCYMLLMLLATINSIFLFKFNKKTKLKYLISTILILYTHFYSAFFVFYNFIFGLTIFKNSKLISFIKINILAFLCYLPLIIYKKTSLISDFNSWIKTPTLLDYSLAIKVFCLNFIVFICFFALLIYLYLKSNKKQKLFITYNSFAIISVFIFAILFTYLIKPIFCYRYFYIIFPCFLALSIFVMTFKYKIKYLIPILIFVFCFISQRVNYQKLFCNHNLYLDFVQKDINQNKQNYIFMSDTVSKYKEFQDLFKDKNAKIIYLPINTGMKTLILEEYNIKKPSVVYVLNLYLDEKTINEADVELYKTLLGVFSRVEFK